MPFDEQGSFVKKKPKHGSSEETSQAGDFWDHRAIAPDSKWILSLVVGKGTQEQTQELVSDTPSGLPTGHLPALFSDAYEGYAASILEACGRRYAASQTGLAGRPRLDLMRWPQGFADGQGMSQDWP